MNFKKFISFGLLNALMLLLVATLIASCQKKSIPEDGLFTSYLNSVKRYPASMDQRPKHNIIDPKQIYIYCQANSVAVETCFNHHLNQKISEFKKSNPEHVTSVVGEDFKQSHSFQTVAHEVKLIETSILAELFNNTKDLVDGRLIFCKNYAKKYPNRCMLQYLQRDSMNLLNKYQQAHKSINAHEYIYLKNLIQKDLEPKLEAAGSTIQI